MKLPKKGTIVPFSEIKKLCVYFDMMELWDKIKSDPPPKPFKSDGCSGGWPDEWKNVAGKKVNLYPECLKHDLRYWAGHKGEDVARFLADTELVEGVVVKTKRVGLATNMFLGVRAGGVSWLPTKFRWGFGRY